MTLKNLVPIVLLFLLLSCGGRKKNTHLQEGKGGIKTGGVFRENEVEEFKSLYPLNITEVTGHRIANQMYEGLVKLSQEDLTVLPSIAYRWEISPDGLTYIFHLRKGVVFHDDPCFPGGKGRDVTAHDFLYCFLRTCTPDANNMGFWVFENKVKGASEYYRAKMRSESPSGIEGFEVMDDSTFRILLVKPFAPFLSLLSTPFAWVYPEEAVEKHGLDLRSHAVGTGAFRMKAVQEGISVILTRNPSYWGKDRFGNSLPYLDGVRFGFIKEQKSELLEFKKGNLEMTYRFPTEFRSEIVGENKKLKGEYKKFILQRTPSMSIQYYGFLIPGKIFKDKRIRQAFNYAIDREKIVKYVLKGEAYALGHYGIVPPSFKNYDVSKVQGYSFNPELGRKMLAEAGYPDGKKFPEVTLQLNSGGSRNAKVAEAVQKMLMENLNIRVQLKLLDWPTHLENYETGKADFWRTGWIADYPDPENFLNILHSKHIPPKITDKAYLNSVRYSNPEFDRLLEKAISIIDDKERYRAYQEADRVAMQDAPILPIYYDEDYRLLQPYVRNFPANAMEYRDYSEVWLDK